MYTTSKPDTFSILNSGDTHQPTRNSGHTMLSMNISCLFLGTPKALILFLAFASLSACLGRQPTVEELAQKYTAAPEAFEALDEMIRVDSKRSNCFAVGLDHIGDYWKFNTGWTHKNDYETKLTTEEVLATIGMERSRYAEYLRLFQRTGSERVSHCASSTYVAQTFVLVHRSGLAVSGCSGTIEKRRILPKPTGKRGNGDFTEITPLGGEWYLRFECT